MGITCVSSLELAWALAPPTAAPACSTRSGSLTRARTLGTSATKTGFGSSLEGGKGLGSAGEKSAKSRPTCLASEGGPCGGAGRFALSRSSRLGEAGWRLLPGWHKATRGSKWSLPNGFATGGTLGTPSVLEEGRSLLPAPVACAGRLGTQAVRPNLSRKDSIFQFSRIPPASCEGREHRNPSLLGLLRGSRGPGLLETFGRSTTSGASARWRADRSQ